MALTGPGDPAEEGVAGGLHETLAVHHSLALVLVLAGARIREALGREKVQTTADSQTFQQVVGPDCCNDSPACSPTGAPSAPTLIRRAR